MIRPDISRLQKNRSIYMKIGFIVSISLCVMAFNYTTFEKPLHAPPEEIVEFDNDIPVVRTPPQKKKPLPPPPKLEVLDKIIEDTPEFIEEPEPEPIDDVVDVEPAKDPIVSLPVTPTEPAPEPAPIVLPQEEEELDDIFIFVEEMPRFQGCDEQQLNKEEKRLCSDRKMMEFIYKNIKYPAIARENNIQGTVVIAFVVEKDGSIGNARIMREIGGGCGKESLRVVKKMPDWVPGRQRNRKVRVEYKLPVQFRLD
ncbi:MAG: energy transducer TonB [Bacteroidota bacterium]